MRREEQIGWGMFVVSAVLFGWSGIRSGDPLALAGSIVFGLACFLFLMPDRRNRSRDDER